MAIKRMELTAEQMENTVGGVYIDPNVGKVYNVDTWEEYSCNNAEAVWNWVLNNQSLSESEKISGLIAANLIW